VDGVSKKEKHRLEEVSPTLPATLAFVAELTALAPVSHIQVAMESFLEEMLGGGEAADRIRDLWNEYEAGATPEAKFVKDLDRLELCLQTVEYERRESTRHPAR
jgi:5'-deoxynucleotidase YfbR-like HD superfamily hydrolase